MSERSAGWRRAGENGLDRGLGAIETHALVLQQLLQLAFLEHLTDDIAAADELALDVELGDGRPVARSS